MPADIEVKGLIETQRKMEQVVKDLHGTPMLKALRDSTLIVERAAKKYAPVDTGRLRASITPEVRTQGETVMGVVGSNVQYAAAVELGSRPHFPPLLAIASWVHRKGLAGTYSVKSHRRLGGVQVQSIEDLTMAWYISLKIARKGTKGVHFLQRAIDDNRSRIVGRIELVVKEIVDK